jgi:adenosine deaminase
MRLTACIALSFVLAFTSCSLRPGTRTTEREAHVARIFLSYEHQGPPALRAFLVNFPKGADLHVHLSGAVYAETFIRDSAEDGLCVDPQGMTFAKPPCSGKLVPAKALSGDITPANQELYDKLIDAFSMRSFVPMPSHSGHDQFFSTFDHFRGLKGGHTGEWVNEIAARSAAQNQQYLELMETPPFDHARQAADDAGWTPDLAAMRQKLLSRGLFTEVAADRDDVRNAEAQREQIERCGTPQAAPACSVEVRYIYQVLRGAPPERVFAQTLLGFETVKQTMDSHEPGFIGINFVMPEDGYISMRDYTLQMKMLDYLHGLYPQVNISLHAGELAPGMVPPEGERFHIRQAVELGHAQRIGHGVDVMDEDNAPGLLKEMAQNHIMVEINLSSNEGILNVKGDDHPFPIYRLNHVPVALSTDDEGVSRIDLTHEYVRAAIDYNLTYQDLKQMARTGMEHSFLPGASLWAAPDVFTAAAADCQGETLGSASASDRCKAFLNGSEKAAAQWELERRFVAFEANY